MFLFSPLDPPCSVSFRNPVLFFKTRFETFQIHRNPGLCAFRRRSKFGTGRATSIEKLRPLRPGGHSDAGMGIRSKCPSCHDLDYILSRR
jgi:hypothetical protein